MSRRRWRYGKPSYGYKAALRFMREYAKSQRDWRLDTRGFITNAKNATAHGGALGAVSSLYEAGALSKRQYDRMFARMRRINNAGVTRRPFELRRAA